MNFIIDREGLLSSLLFLQKIIPTRTTIPILSSVFIKTKENKILLRGTDLEISIKLYVSAEIKEEGIIVVPLKRLLDITSEIPKGKIEIKLIKNKITLSTEYGKYSLTSGNLKEFPEWINLDEKEDVILKKDILEYIINKTSYAVSKDDIKPSLQGVLFDFNNKKLKVVATDGAKLVEIKTKIENDLEKQIIVPIKFLSVIRTHLKNKEINMVISKNHVLLKTETSTITSRLIKQQYPDYESVIPLDNDKKLSLDKQKLLGSIKRVSIFCNRTTKQITFNLKNRNLKIFAQDPENVSTGEENITCEYIGEEFNIGFNSDYLKEVINKQEEGTIDITMKNPVSAALFKNPSINKNEMISLLMPIRINE